jgi:hypothetical protein
MIKTIRVNPMVRLGTFWFLSPFKEGEVFSLTKKPVFYDRQNSTYVHKLLGKDRFGRRPSNSTRLREAEAEDLVHEDHP